MNTRANVWPTPCHCGSKRRVITIAQKYAVRARLKQGIIAFDHLLPQVTLLSQRMI